MLHNCCASAFIDAYNSRCYLKNAGKITLNDASGCRRHFAVNINIAVLLLC